MFELTLAKQQLLQPLLLVANAVDKKQTLSILANVLLTIEPQQLLLTATDLEIEITGRIPCITQQAQGAVTVPAKKMIDILRSLDDDAHPAILFNDSIVSIREGRSQFKLATLPANDYPKSESDLAEIELTIQKEALIRLFQSTYFAMAQQDVRMFLNGLLFEIENSMITAVATDGHRMAISKLACEQLTSSQRILIPRKGIQEALRLLNHVSDEKVVVTVSKNQIMIITTQFTFSSKLIEARFPPYSKAIPRQQDKHVIIDSDLLKRALTRIMILANEKSRAIILQIQDNQLTLCANNQELEEAIETIGAQTQGGELKIGMNATYLLDVLNDIEPGPMRLSFSNADGSILVETPHNDLYQYIIMPMKI